MIVANFWHPCHPVQKR